MDASGYIGFFQFPTLTYDLHQSRPEAIRHGLLQPLGRQWCASSWGNVVSVTFCYNHSGPFHTIFCSGKNVVHPFHQT